MAEVIAISNQKGGVGKTTTAVNLGAALAESGYSVLVVDFDPQGNATSGLGCQKSESSPDLYEMFFGQASLKDIILPTAMPNLFVAPSSADLVSIEVELGKTAGRELILSSQIRLLLEGYDYILIDCPPSSALLSLNALGAAKWVLIPLQAEYYALEGLSSLMQTIDFVQKTFNPRLEILGVFLTMYDIRTRLSSQVQQEVEEFFGPKALKARIPRNIKLSEAPSHGLPINLYAPESTGARAYGELAMEVQQLLHPQDVSQEVELDTVVGQD